MKNNKMIDIHIHGANGHDFSDGETGDFQAVADYLESVGVSGFLATGMSVPGEDLLKIADTAKKFAETQTSGAKFLGLHLEGPFLNPDKKGAQNGKYIISPDWTLFDEICRRSGGMVKTISIAPEIDGAIDFIERAAGQGIAVSLAHTSADYDTAMRAFKAGANRLTHTFNAMPPFNHRLPGVIGAAIDSGAYAEIICDGVHVHPSVVRAAWRMFGADRIVLISDSMRAAGLVPGEYTLGGLEVFVDDRQATLADGTIAGSITNLNKCVANVIEWGISESDAYRAACDNPLKAIGMVASA